MRSVQEAAGTGLLHDLSTGVTTHPTEGVITEDDGTVLHLCIGDDKLTIFGGRGRRRRRGGLGRQKKLAINVTTFKGASIKSQNVKYTQSTKRKLPENDIIGP